MKYQISTDTITKIATLLSLSVLTITIVATLQLYSSYQAKFPKTESNVLGEKTEVSDVKNSCISNETVVTALKEGERSIRLFSPTKDIDFDLYPIASCIETKGCETPGVACAEVQVTVNAGCLAEYFSKYPVAITTKKYYTKNDLSVAVRVEDWDVNYGVLVNQLSDAIKKEVSYCELTGEIRAKRQKIGSIQLTVNENSASADGSFAKRFLEIDRSKSLVYLWNDGVSQYYPLKQGAKLPANGIYSRADFVIEKLVQSLDVAYFTRNTESGDYVVVHD